MTVVKGGHAVPGLSKVDQKRVPFVCDRPGVWVDFSRILLRKSADIAGSVQVKGKLRS